MTTHTVENVDAPSRIQVSKGKVRVRIGGYRGQEGVWLKSRVVSDKEVEDLAVVAVVHICPGRVVPLKVLGSVHGM
jgi:hypothetical protein